MYMYMYYAQQIIAGSHIALSEQFPILLYDEDTNGNKIEFPTFKITASGQVAAMFPA